MANSLKRHNQPNNKLVDEGRNTPHGPDYHIFGVVNIPSPGHEKFRPVQSLGVFSTSKVIPWGEWDEVRSR